MEKSRLGSLNEGPNRYQVLSREPGTQTEVIITRGYLGLLVLPQPHDRRYAGPEDGRNGLLPEFNELNGKVSLLSKGAMLPGESILVP